MPTARARSTPITSQTPLRDGDRIRVKSDPYTRRYGVRCYSRISPADDHLTAGEVGTVHRSAYKCHTGEMVGHWIVEFLRGRIVTLSCDADPEAVTARFLLDSECGDFVKVCA